MTKIRANDIVRSYAKLQELKDKTTGAVTDSWTSYIGYAQVEGREKTIFISEAMRGLLKAGGECELQPVEGMENCLKATPITSPGLI